MRFGLTVATLLALTSAAYAHDIPSDVTVQAFLKPSGQHLELLVRVPLQAMRDMIFPERGPGYLDLEKVEPLLTDSAIQWIANFVDIDEDSTHLPRAEDCRHAGVTCIGPLVRFL